MNYCFPELRHSGASSWNGTGRRSFCLTHQVLRDTLCRVSARMDVVRTYQQRITGCPL